jgi:quercetin dioxygenase-like cupin family protein
MKLSAGGPVSHYRWDDLPAEQLKRGLSRKVITGQRMMIGQFDIRIGEAVARHSHENEQIAYVLSGALHMWFGARDEHEVIIRAGEVVVIPSHLPHRSVALEDTLEIDVFSPPRQDWLSGTDAYLRG